MASKSTQKRHHWKQLVYFTVFILLVTFNMSFLGRSLYSRVFLSYFDLITPNCYFLLCSFVSFYDLVLNRSNRSQMSLTIGVLKIFAKFTGKHLCWILFLIKLQARTFFTEHLWWLLLTQSTFVWSVPTDLSRERKF